MALGVVKLLKIMMGATTTANVNLTNMMALNIVGTQHLARASSWLTFSFGIFTFFVCLCRVLRVLGLFFFAICGVCLILSFVVLSPIKIQTDAKKARD